MKFKTKFEDFNISDLNFNELCRFCLSDKGILLSIFQFKGSDDPNELPTQIKRILSIEMEENDGLPSLICHCCLFNIEKTIDFKNQCEQADEILRSYMKNQGINYLCKDQSTKILNKENDENLMTNDGSEGLAENPNCEDLSGNLNHSIDDSIQETGNGSLTKDTACQAEFTDEKIEPTTEESTETEGQALDNNLYLNDETAVVNGNEGMEEEEAGLGMDESMNDLEDERIGSEPFSLDLCSLRLQSEGVVPEDEVWSESGSDLSDEFEYVEPTRVLPQPGTNCPTCNKAFTLATELQRHQQIHKQEPPYPCDYCDQQFEEKTLLKAHWRWHARSKPHVCMTCGEAYAERSLLAAHFAVHDVIKPYHCPSCGKAFAYRSDLRKHAIIHTGARPFKCPVCSKTFTRSTNLNKHARVHSGRRPYPCNHCDKMFSSRGDLARHAVIHTGEKPYACTICSLAFNRKDKLSRHERVHITDRPYACNECPTSFQRKEELTKHSRFHHYRPDPSYYNTGAEQVCSSAL